MSDSFDLLLDNLAGGIPRSLDYLSKEQAYEELKRISGEDWGYDIEAWRKRKSRIMRRFRTGTPIRDAESAREREVQMRQRKRKRST